jgi:hypothetical protein
MRALERRGVRAVLTRRHDGRIALTFMISAGHSPSAVDRAARIVSAVLGSERRVSTGVASAYAAHAG